jgi:hypothetical protein
MGHASNSSRSLGGAAAEPGERNSPPPLEIMWCTSGTMAPLLMRAVRVSACQKQEVSARIMVLAWRASRWQRGHCIRVLTCSGW